jgi:parallel beta-helix repeat protein
LLKRIGTGVLVTLSLINMLALAFNIQPVEASGTIYIRSDGSIDPPTVPIQCVADVYTFTDDIYNKSIEVRISNITLDGNGHLLCGPTTGKHIGFGIHLRWRKNVTITDIVISNSHAYSIFLDESSNCRIVNNSILSIDCMWGIRLVDSHHNLLTNNTVMNTYKAIELVGSSYNILSNNEVIDNTHGIWLNGQYHPSTGNTLRNNVMTDNKHSFLVYSHFMSRSGYINDVDTSNIVDGKPIYYWINRCNETIPLDASCVVIVDSSGITVKNLRLRNTATGVCLAYTENSVIENVTATTNYLGIWLEHSDSNIITKNNLTDNDGPGIFLGWSGHNNLTDNFVQNTNSSGIWLEDCLPGYNTLIGNTVLYSRTGKTQEWDGAGILVDDSDHCKVIDNNVTSNSFGIVVGATQATANQLSGNNIVMNDVGLMLGGAVHNVIYHNNFIDNKLQVDTGKGMWEPRNNTFDSGYPSGGNYWSNYTGVDLFSGPYQNEMGSDGIGDTRHVLDENNEDNYPLMGMFYFTVEIEGGQIYHVTAISNSTVSDFHVVLWLSSPNEYLQPGQKFIGFYLTGEERTIGFCRTMIPRAVLNDSYTVLVDWQEVTVKELPISNSTHAYLYFTYNHSTKEVIIIPEFPSFLILPLFMTATLLAVVVYKRKPQRNIGK